MWRSGGVCGFGESTDNWSVNRVHSIRRSCGTFELVLRFTSANLQWSWVKFRRWEKVPGIVLLPVRYRRRVSTMCVDDDSWRRAKLRVSCVGASSVFVFLDWEFHQEYLSWSTRREIFLKIYPLANWGNKRVAEDRNIAGGSCYFRWFAHILLSDVFATEVSRGREIMLFMLYYNYLLTFLLGTRLWDQGPCLYCLLKPSAPGRVPGTW